MTAYIVACVRCDTEITVTTPKPRQNPVCLVCRGAERAKNTWERAVDAQDSRERRPTQ